MDQPLPLSAKELKAVAHPLRIALLENLGYRGAMTATQLADLVGESPSNCSWHLRKLADAGLVERAEGRNDRDRPWQLTFDSYEFAAGERDQRVRSLLVHRQADRMLRAMAALDATDPDRDSGPASGTGHGAPPATQGSNGTWLTDDEARAVIDAFHQLQALVPDFERRRVDPAARPAGSRLYEFVGWLVPVEDEL